MKLSSMLYHFFLTLSTVEKLRCHVSGVFISCDCRGVRDDFIL